ncbi:MAG: hypothetical protein ACYTGQ_07410, partial [Planctomycetota bacterium]
VYTALTPTAAAFLGGAWTWAVFIHHTMNHKPRGDDAPASLVKDDRFWAGLLASVAIFMMYYYA